MLRKNVRVTITELINNLLLEQQQSENVLHLTANENVMSKLAESFLSSNLSSRYYFGNHFAENILQNIHYLVKGLTLRGMPAVAALEEQATLCAKEMFHAAYCDFRAVSGMHAVICILAAITKPHDNVYIFTAESVGHHATIKFLKNIGRKISFFPWSNEEYNIDLPSFKHLISENKPDALFFDFGTTLYPLALKEIRAMVGKDVPMIYDGSHVLGLIAGQQFQNPLQEGCDILIGNTHKSFPGPQKAIIAYKDESLGKKMADELIEGAFSSQHTHHALALYVTLIEMKLFGEEYAKQIVKNTHALSQTLQEDEWKLIGKPHQYSLSHMLGIASDRFVDSRQACIQLQKCNISTNAKKLFGIDAIRIGVQEVTRKGMKEEQMHYIAKLFQKIIHEKIPVAKAIAQVESFIKPFSKRLYAIDEFYLKIFN